MRLRRLVTGVVAIVAAAAVTLVMLPGPKPAPLPARNGPSLLSARAWGYQLQGAQADLIPPEVDLVVIDHARDASATDLLTAADVAAFRSRRGAPDRIVLAYMSIGEAERYRYYWRKAWSQKATLGLLRPGWLARENKDWKGNYLVRFWEPGWQKVILNPAPSLLDAARQAWLGAPEAYIDKILEAGFDGVYLDRVDVFGEWEKSRPTAEADMSAFVMRLSAYAKARRPGFLVVPQNGEELVANQDYRRAIDGLAKEDLLFGAEKENRANDREETRRSIALLQKVRGDGKPVFVVEYLRDDGQRAIARARTTELGFAVTFAERDLARPPEGGAPLVPAVATPTTAPLPAAPAMPKPHR